MPLQRNDFLPQNLLTVYPASSGMVDIRTGLPYLAGGLYPGVYFDLTEAEAQNLSVNTLHAGRYRFVQVDTGATAANILAGTVGGMVPGKSVQTVVIKTAGSGQTAGTYTATASSGSATIQYVINAGGTLASVTVTNGGSGYTTTPTFTIAAGGTPGTVGAEMALTFNSVTDAAHVLGTGGLRPCVFLAPLTSAQVTAGSYVFVQESGEAIVLGKTSLTNGAPAVGDTIVFTTTGVVDDPTQSGSITYAIFPTIVGDALDIPVSTALFKVQLAWPMMQG